MSNANNPPRRALGRGLDALLPAKAPPAQQSGGGERNVFLCPVEKLVPQPGQPRQHFDEAELVELTQSIVEHGLIEPIVVRRTAPGVDKFEIIAGERRWRASQRAGVTEVLVVVKDVSPKDAFELALVENVQRSDLNPIEISEAYDRLLREHAYTQDSLATRVGKDRTTITNALRLLKLPQKIRTMVIARELSEGHARAILGAPTDASMADIAEKAARGKLPVRKVEALVRAAKDKANGVVPKPKEVKSASIRDLEARLMRKLGTRTEVRDADGKGEIAISYGSLDELDRIIAQLGV
jgi:ParB family chromosome partitioning protein